MTSSPPTANERFKPNAAREMASMFDDVSGRYDLLNRVMTLGQDGAWREAMWRRVPASANVVLDLCTGSGVSLPGMVRAGRTVLGVDVSLRMLQVADRTLEGGSWTPRLACADGFHLPFGDSRVDAVTVAFGIRNLRPRRESLAEIARVLVPGGRLVVLEAAAPGPGPLAPFTRAWIRHAIPLAGRLSPDPSAYRYLSESIFEFGSGPEFEADLAASGYTLVERRAFLLGAARLWVAEKSSAGVPHDARVQSATSPGTTDRRAEAERASRSAADAWRLLRAITSGAVCGALLWALREWLQVRANLPMAPAHQMLLGALMILGAVVFGVRALVQLLAWEAVQGGERGRG